MLSQRHWGVSLLLVLSAMVQFRRSLVSLFVLGSGLISIRFSNICVSTFP